MAGLIPQSFIDELLERVDLVEVIDKRVPLKKSGRNYMACCPFHDEKTPSFSIQPDKQFYYCFGCGASGNAISFLLDYDRVDFPTAIEQLAQSVGLQVPREQTQNPEKVAQRRDLYSLMELAASYFQRQLKEHPQAQQATQYLKGRGLSGEIAKQFGIGYAPPGWDNLLTALGQNERDKQLLIEGGMLVEKPEENKCYDRFRDRIMFPIRDSRGRVIAFGGRVMGDDKPKYLNSPETPIFHKSRELYGFYESRKNTRHLHRLLIVEGYMDVVALAQYGLNWSAATLGTATSTEHLQKVFRSCSEVVFCFDGDDAGKRAASRALESCLPAMQDGNQARFLFLPQGEDPDSLIRKIGDREFIRQVDQATPLEDYLFSSCAEGLNIEHLEGRATLSTRVAPLIAKIPDGVYKQLMLSALAERTGLNKTDLLLIIENQINEQKAAQSTTENASNKHEGSAQTNQSTPQPIKRQALDKEQHYHKTQRNLVLYAIGILLLHPQSSASIKPFHPLDESLEQQLLADLVNLTQKQATVSTQMLLGNWLEAPWKSLIGKAIIQAQEFGLQGSAHQPEKEFTDTINSLLNQKQQLEIDHAIRQLTRLDYSSLNEEQKLELQNLIKNKAAQK